MKVLIINDLLVSGGAELQSRREKELLNKNHESYLLTFDCNIQTNDFFNEINGFYNIPVKNNKFLKIYNKLFINYYLKKKVDHIIKKINPDIIHINNNYIAPKTVYSSLKKYSTIQTIRDYSYVCPFSTCIDDNYQICHGKKYENCYKRCKKRTFNLIIKNILYSVRVNSSKKYISKYICPSEKLTDYCQKHGYNVECVNNPFDFKTLENFVKKIDKSKKIYLYYGSINENKGVFRLIEAFQEFSKTLSDVELVLAGKVEDRAYFNQILSGTKKINYVGYLQYDEVLRILEKTYAVIVPSLWMENYPNTVLEGLATKTLVIGSDRGGIPDMLKNQKGIIFNILDKEDIIEKLNTSYYLTNEQYQSFVTNGYNYTIQNNSLENYYERLIDIFDNLNR